MTTSAIFEKLVLHAPQLSGKHVISALPAFVYGTAWKKKATSDLVYQALCNGFTAIDTAAQPKHYQEDLVAAGISRAIKDGKTQRSDVYIQTKFTSVTGQDPENMPFDPKIPLAEQVNASVMSSLKNFNFADVVDGEDAQYIDTVVLHSPMPTLDETLEAWQTLEQYVPGEIRNLGISNCNLFTLMELYERARIKPSVVQNRFYANTKFDIGIRQFCKERNIVYQSFWTLSGNPSLVWSNEVGSLANQLGISTQSALYCLVLGLGNISILNGTKSAHHMLEDWKAVASGQGLRSIPSRRMGQSASRFQKTYRPTKTLRSGCPGLERRYAQIQFDSDRPQRCLHASRDRSEFVAGENAMLSSLSGSAIDPDARDVVAYSSSAKTDQQIEAQMLSKAVLLIAQRRSRNLVLHESAKKPYARLVCHRLGRTAHLCDKFLILNVGVSTTWSK